MFKLRPSFPLFFNEGFIQSRPNINIVNQIIVRPFKGGYRSTVYLQKVEFCVSWLSRPIISYTKYE